MNTDSIITRRVAFGEMRQPGDFTFDEDFSHIFIMLPGMRHADCLAIQEGPDDGRKRIWGWDGNVELPTLTPSIHDVGNWHGYLRAGKLESC